MFEAMTRFLLFLTLATACRPSDPAARSTPSSTAAAQPAAREQSEPARADSLLGLADEGRIQGAENAPVWLIEISDFQCQFCKQWHDDVYPAIRREYIEPGVVRMAYINLPLPQHQHAEAAAEAAMCAAVQGRFWPLHDRIFDTQERWSRLPAAGAFFDSLAVATRVDTAQFRDCVRSGLMGRLINADRSRASAAGVRSTPTFFVGDEPIQGVAPVEAFRQAIARQRAKAPGRPQQ